MKPTEKQDEKLGNIETIESQLDVACAAIDAQADDYMLNIMLAKLDIDLIKYTLCGMVNDDVYVIKKVVELLPAANLSIATLSFGDTDGDLTYSMLGLAKYLGSVKVVAYLTELGCTEDFIDDSIILH